MTRLLAYLKEHFWDAPSGRCSSHNVPLPDHPGGCDICLQEQMEALELQDQKEYERKLRHEAQVYAQEIAKVFNK